MQFEAMLLESRLATDGDVVVRLSPLGAASDYARNRDGAPNPDAWCFAGWIDVPNARRDQFVTSLQARYAAKACVHGALVDRDGYSAVQPLDALWVRLEPDAYGGSARTLVADLGVFAEDQAGAHYESERFFTVHRVFASADASDFARPPGAEGERRVTFAIELPIGPSPGGRAAWTPKVQWWPEVEEHVTVSTAITRHGAQRATVAVSFALGHKPSESVLIGDLAVYWAPDGSRS